MESLQMGSIEEDQAESVDSGCVPDLTTETSWNQVRLALNYEYNFALGLLQHTPLYKNLDYNPLINDKLLNVSSKEEPSILSNIVKEEKVEKMDIKDKNQKKISRKQLVALERKKKRKLQIMKIKHEKRAIVPQASTSAEQARKVYNQCGKLVFSKFDFSNCIKEKWEENRKPDLNFFLSKVLKEKEQIKHLQDRGKVDKAADMLKSQVWENAMKKAEGEKVKDNDFMIKKSLKKKKAQKNRGKAKWTEIENTVKDRQQQRQEKRKENLAKRKLKKTKGNKTKGNKKKGNKKKGKTIPGF